MKNTAVHVMKFGGSSISSAARIRAVAKIVASTTQIDPLSSLPVVILSAMGQTTSNLIDLATKAANTTNEVSLEKIQEVHIGAMRDLGIACDKELLSEIQKLLESCSQILRGVGLIRELTDTTLDVIMSFGERMSVRIFAAYLRTLGVKAVAKDAYDIGFKTTGSLHGSSIRERIGAELAPECYDQISKNVQGYIESGIVLIVTGFIALNQSGRIVTLGRGGSDFTASIIGAAVKASSVQIWTDTDGVLTGDPRAVNNPRSIANLTFEEAGELAYFGAKVLHPRTIQPARDAGVPVQVCNSHNPSHPGTKICDVMPGQRSHLITAVSLKSPVILVDIRANQMMGQFGFLGEVFSIFAKYEISVDVIATSEVSVSITLDKDTLVDNVFAAKEALRHTADVQIFGARSIIALIGDNTKAAKVLSIACGVLQENDISIDMVSLSASKLNTSLVVSIETGARAMTLLHDFFFPSFSIATPSPSS